MFRNTFTRNEIIASLFKYFSLHKDKNKIGKPTVENQKRSVERSMNLKDRNMVVIKRPFESNG